MNDPSQSSDRLIDTIKAESGLSHSQIQIWTGQKVHPDSPFCNMAFALVIEGAIEEQRFQKAWLSTLQEDDVLLTSIVETQGTPKVETLSAASCSTRFLDFSTNENPVDAFKQFAHEQASHLLPLNGPLLESILVRLSANRFGWFLNQHHIIMDASSTLLLFKRVSQNYAKTDSKELNDKPLQYKDVYQTLESATTTHGYWKAKSAANPVRINPVYGRKGDKQDTRSTRIQISLSPEQSQAIRDLSKHDSFASFFPEISVYALFSTLLAALLRRTAAQDRISFDSPAGNRPSREAKSSLGCFIEMFPFDIESEKTDTFATLGAKAMAEIGEFLRNAAPGASAPNGASASNVVLNYFPLSFEKFGDFPVKADWIHSQHIDGVYDLKLQVHDYNGCGSFAIQFDLSDSTFTEYDQRRIPQHFQSLLEAMLEEMDTEIDTIDILTPEEKGRTIEQFNTPTQPNSYSSPNSLLDLIHAQVMASPHAIALREKSKTVTYQDLWDRSKNVAQNLRNQGVDTDNSVALLLPRSIDLVIAIIAVLRAGSAYIPIDPKYPSNRIKKILSNSRAKFVIGQGTQPKSLDCASDWTTLESLEAESFEKDLPEIDPKNLAYIIYTSGSTGQPKGVEIEHEGLTDYICWAERSYVRGRHLAYPLFTSIAFDLTITSIFLPLITGGELIVYPQLNDAVDHGIIDVINENAVDFIKLTPSHLSLLKNLDLTNSRLNCLVLGGEDLKQSLADEVTRAFKNPVELYNEYGPTEAVVGCMIHQHDPEETGASVPIGKPSSGVSIYLLNESGTPVPEGTSGEIYIERKGLARGYRNDPEKTAASFVPNPINRGERSYKTGDLARFSKEGTITYLGRIDSQIKRSGFRVELGEIESAVARHPLVRSAHVRVVERKTTSTRPSETAHCVRCGISSHYPSVVFDEQGVCGICASYETIKDDAQAYFKSSHELQELFDSRRIEKNPNYDCMVFFSGGKDSAYALCKLVDMGLKVYAFTLDNGYLSEQAMENISRVTKALGVDHEFARTDSMNEIFRDSLTRFSNVCNGCFKTIYTLGINRAHALGIPTIVTGLSRGQFFETRLTENLFINGKFSPQQVDDAVLEARKNYHRTEDAATRCLDNRLFQDDAIFQEILFLDFYRYWSAPLEEIYSYLDKRVPWVRPSDTGRSTNCRINDVGIYIHQKERGFHNYALPYSWDVRLDQKERDEAKEELDDQFDLSEVKQMLSEIGYDENRLVSDKPRSDLVAYYESSAPIPTSELVATTDQYLPPQLRPNGFTHVQSMPLTANGKVDTNALPNNLPEDTDVDYKQANGEVEEHVFEVWAQYLGTRRFGVDDSFFQIGGVSLAAMEITLQLCKDFEIDLPLQSIFQFSTVTELSERIEEIILSEIEEMSSEEVDKALQSDS